MPASDLPPLPPPPDDPQPHDFPGLRNVVTYHPGVYSGSVPEGKTGFQTLHAWGVRTIIDVDGMPPDVALASAYDIRPIHLPVEYNGFEHRQSMQFTRAARDGLTHGAVYIHCHHGKHRSASVAASIAVGMGWLTPADALARMNVSGTSPNYPGLFACAASTPVLSSQELDSVPDDFPSVCEPRGIVQGMIDIDRGFDRLKLIEGAHWTTPADHPDLVPAAEAARLADLFRSLSHQVESANQTRTLAANAPTTPEADLRARQSAELSTRFSAASRAASALEELLVTPLPAPADLAAALRSVARTCTDCHATYRDAPQR